MFNVNAHIKKFLLNEYKGSDKKDTVLLDDNCKYMLKKPDPTREKERQDVLSYINNAFSEYIGCHIAKLLGFEVQDTILGEYAVKNKSNENVTKIVCLCKDIRRDNEQLREFDTIGLSSDETNESVTFNNFYKITEHIKDKLDLSDDIETQIIEFYNKLFILDAFIGNTDRHNGNVGILLDNNGNFSRISPVYDCGSSLLPLIADEEITPWHVNSLGMSICSVILDENGKRINYKDFLLNRRIPGIDKALTEVICNINLKEIEEMIQNTDYLTEVRKQFYIDVLTTRYEKIFIPALEQIFVNNEISQTNDENIDLYSIYLKNIKEIADSPEFCKFTLYCQNNTIDVIRINKKYALLIKDDICKGLLPIRSNNSEIRKAIAVLQSLGMDILQGNIEIEKDEDYDR